MSEPPTIKEIYAERRDEVLRGLMEVWLFYYSLRRVPAVVQRVCEGERLTLRETATLVSTINGAAYFVGVQSYRGFCAAREARESERMIRARRRWEKEQETDSPEETT